MKGEFLMNLFFNTILNENFIINLILEIIFVEVSLIFFHKIFKTQFSIHNYVFFALINTICFIFGNLLGNCIYAYCFMLFGSMIFIIHTQKVSNLKVLSFISLGSIFVLNIHFCIFKTLYITTSYSSYLKMITLPICGIITIISMSIIGLIIHLCLQHRKLDPLFIYSFNQHAALINSISVLNLCIVYTIFYRFFEILSQNIFYILTLNLYFYFSLKVVIHLCYSNFIRQKINNLRLRNKTILSMYDETRAFKHDFHNILQAIGGYIIINDMAGLKKYYKQISNDCILSNNLAKLNPELINNPAIYNILADKYHLASNHNIQINLDVMLDLNHLNMNIYELTRIMGILLDNAIEASKECKEKSINISFKQDAQKQLLIIENTYTNKQICIDKIFEKDFSTKPHNTGLGLWEVKKILSKNNNLNLHTSKNNNYFSQQLEIYSA